MVIKFQDYLRPITYICARGKGGDNPRNRFFSCLTDYLSCNIYYTKCVAANLNNVNYSLSEQFCLS